MTAAPASPEEPLSVRRSRRTSARRGQGEPGSASGFGAHLGAVGELPCAKGTEGQERSQGAEPDTPLPSDSSFPSSFSRCSPCCVSVTCCHLLRGIQGARRSSGRAWPQTRVSAGENGAALYLCSHLFATVASCQCGREKLSLVMGLFPAVHKHFRAKRARTTCSAGL